MTTSAHVHPLEIKRQHLYTALELYIEGVLDLNSSQIEEILISIDIIKKELKSETKE